MTEWKERIHAQNFYAAVAHEKMQFSTSHRIRVVEWSVQRVSRVMRLGIFQPLTKDFLSHTLMVNCNSLFLSLWNANNSEIYRRVKYYFHHCERDIK